MPGVVWGPGDEVDGTVEKQGASKEELRETQLNLSSVTELPV